MINENKISNRFKQLFETNFFLIESITFKPYGNDYDEYFDDDEFNEGDGGMDDDEINKQASNIAKLGEINILRNKELSGILIDEDINIVAGAVWIDNSGEHFDFDIAIHPKYQRQGLSKQLIEYVLSEYDYIKDGMGEGYSIMVHVVNPMMAKILSTYGFKVQADYGGHGVVMYFNH